MKRFFCFILLVCAFCISACAQMPARGDYVEGSAPQINYNPNLGTVCFLRESSLIGGGMSYYVNEDDRRIGLLRSGTYFIHQTQPGKHTFWAETETKAAVTLDILPGHKYFIKGGVGIGVWAGRPELVEVTEAVASKLLPELKYVRLATPEESKAYKQAEVESNTDSEM